MFTYSVAAKESVSAAVVSCWPLIFIRATVVFAMRSAITNRLGRRTCCRIDCGPIHHISECDNDLARAGVGIAGVRRQHVVKAYHVALFPLEAHGMFLVYFADMVHYRIFN